MSAPYFPLYADDFLAGTMDLGPEEVGAYIRLLCHQWNRGALPADGAKLKRVAGVAVSADVLAKFTAGPDGLLRNARLEKVRGDMEAFRELQSQKGKASAAARRHRQATAVEPRLESGSASGATPAVCSAENRFEPKSNFPLPLPLPEGITGSVGGDSLTTPAPNPTFEGASNHPATEAAVAAHFERVAPGIYGPDLIHAAWLSFEADAFNGQWMWGKRPVGDWRAAFETRLGQLKARSEGAPRKNGAEKSAPGAPGRISTTAHVIATRPELQRKQDDLDSMPDGPAKRRIQEQLDAQWRELEQLEGGK